MSSLVLIGGVLALFSLPAAAHRYGVRLSPPDWARLIAASLTSGFVLVETALILCSLPVIPGLAEFRVRGHFFPGGGLAGLTSALLAVALPAAAGLSMAEVIRKRRRLRAEPYIGRHMVRHGIDVAVLPTNLLLAIAVPGRPPQIVVSQGLLDSVGPQQMDVIIKHEAAHIRHRHDRYLMLDAGVRLWFRWLPGTRKTLDLFELALEEWADNDAAGDQTHRTLIRTTLMALATTDLGAVVNMIAPERTVLERLASLRRDPIVSPMAGKALIYGTAVALQAVAALPLIVWL